MCDSLIASLDAFTNYSSSFIIVRLLYSYSPRSRRQCLAARVPLYNRCFFYCEYSWHDLILRLSDVAMVAYPMLLNWLDTTSASQFLLTVHIAQIITLVQGIISSWGIKVSRHHRKRITVFSQACRAVLFSSRHYT